MTGATAAPEAEATGQALGNSNDAARCRHCDEVLRDTFVDLGMSPLCESYLGASS